MALFIPNTPIMFAIYISLCMDSNKQTPQAWFQALQKFLLGYNFQNAKSDTSLFIYVKANTFAYFLVYVYDILLT